MIGAASRAATRRAPPCHRDNVPRTTHSDRPEPCGPLAAARVKGAARARTCIPSYWISSWNIQPSCDLEYFSSWIRISISCILQSNSSCKSTNWDFHLGYRSLGWQHACFPAITRTGFDNFLSVQLAEPVFQHQLAWPFSQGPLRIIRGANLHVTRAIDVTASVERELRLRSGVRLYCGLKRLTVRGSEEDIRFKVREWR